MNLTMADDIKNGISLFDEINVVEQSIDDELKERLANMAYISFLTIQSDFKAKSEQGEFINYLFARLDTIYGQKNLTVQHFKISLLKYYIMHHYPHLIENLENK